MAKLKIVSEEKINAKKIAKAVYKTLNQRAKLKAELVFMGEEEMQKLHKTNPFLAFNLELYGSNLNFLLKLVF